MNSATVSFNTTVRQMTEMSQRPKCSAKNDRNVSGEKTGCAANVAHLDNIAPRKPRVWVGLCGRNATDIASVSGLSTKNIGVQGLCCIFLQPEV